MQKMYLEEFIGIGERNGYDAKQRAQAKSTGKEHKQREQGFACQQNSNVFPSSGSSCVFFVFLLENQLNKSWKKLKIYFGQESFQRCVQIFE